MTDSRVNITLIGVLKYLLLAAMAAYLFFQFSGTRTSSTDYDVMEEAVISSAVLDPMSRGDNQMIRRIYQLDPDEYEGMTLYYPTSSMSVEEILLVKLRDTAQQDAVRQAMENRVASQISVFEGYGPEQVAMLQRSVIEVRGNYLLMVVADQPAPVERAFLKAL